MPASSLARVVGSEDSVAIRGARPAPWALLALVLSAAGVAGCCSPDKECFGTLTFEGEVYQVHGAGPNGAVEDGCKQHCAKKKPTDPGCVRACQSKVAGTTPFMLKADCR